MHAIALWLALMATPFWETKAPQDWSAAEVDRLLTDSPWAQTIEGVTMFLATARPAREAERERARRKNTADPEFTDFLEQDQGKHIVLALSYRNFGALADAVEAKKMEEESILRVGKKKYKMTGQFPPTRSDPYLRLVFPREVGPNDKSLVFELYVPGALLTYRMVEFRMKGLVYRGAAEM
jgi:hypothetical protein